VNIFSKISKDKPASVGRLSFDSFVELSDDVTKVTVDDSALASHANRYKVYVSWADEIDALKKKVASKGALDNTSDNFVPDAPRII